MKQALEETSCRARSRSTCGVRAVIHAPERSPAPQLVCGGALSQLMQLVEARRIDLTPLITNRFWLEEVEQAYATLLSPRSKALKMLIAVLSR